MQLDWLNLQDEPFQAMQTATPQLSGLKRNIHGLRILLAVLYEQSLGTRARKETVSVQIFAAMPEVTTVLLQYYTEANVRAGDAMLYDDLINWTRVALRGVIFLEKKIINAMKLTADSFRVLVDPMNNWSHELDMGIKSLEQCR